MAIKLRLFGTVTDAARTLSYTRSGMPRFGFGVRVGTHRSKHYRVTAYGTMARFCDIYLRTGERVHVEGAYLRRYPAFEGLIRADTIRHVGRFIPLFPGTLVRFVVPQTPRSATAADDGRPIPHERRASTAESFTTEHVDDMHAAVN